MKRKLTLSSRKVLAYVTIGCIILMALMIIALVQLLPKASLGPSPQKPNIRKNLSFTPDSPLLPKQHGAQLISKIETIKPVVFLTIDDGQHKEKAAVDFLKSRQWPISLFLADSYARQDYGYFQKIIKNGASVQNHTLSHVYLDDLTYDQQKTEICAASAKTTIIYGKSPTLLRPPGGFYNYNTLMSAKKCGIEAVVMWSAKVDGGMVQLQKGDKLVPGDIVLMHFRPTIMKDLAAFEKEIIKQNLYVARLEDWVQIEP